MDQIQSKLRQKDKILREDKDKLLIERLRLITLLNSIFSLVLFLSARPRCLLSSHFRSIHILSMTIKVSANNDIKN